MRRGIGLIRTCPNALERRAYEAFRWWLEFHQYRILPFAGFDFAGQPHFVAQAIRIGEREVLSAPAPAPRTTTGKVTSLRELAELARQRAGG